MKTMCKKCIFADSAGSQEPCAMNIIDRIKNLHTIDVDDDGFNVINDYRCLYGFDLDTYDKNKDQIGGIDKLTEEIYKRSEVPYYMVVFATESLIDYFVTCVKNLSIKPKYLSVVLFESNNTKKIIDMLSDKLNDTCLWKLHNFLEQESKEKALNIIFDTNKNKNNSQYVWIIDSEHIDNLDKQIADINEIITISKPKVHMLCRTTHFSLNGLFISFDNFRQLCQENEKLISEGIQANTDHLLIVNYC